MPYKEGIEYQNCMRQERGSVPVKRKPGIKQGQGKRDRRGKIKGGGV
jgi:hypothetical protein